MDYSNFRPLAALTISVVMASVCALTACDKSTPQKAKAPLTVNVINVTPSNETVWVQTLGETEGSRQIEVRPQVSGILKKINYVEGSAVKAGDVLFEIEKERYKATLDAASASYAEARATYAHAINEVKRNKNLFKNKAISKKNLDDAIKAERVAFANVQSARAKESDARINYNYTDVKAPSDGVAGRAEVNLGTLVNATSTLLTTLTQPNDLRVKFMVSERDIAGETITTANPVRLYDSKGNVTEAIIDYVSQQIDVTTSTRAFRAKILDKKTLCPGELVRIQLGIKSLPNVYRVPQKAIIQKPDGSFEVLTIENNKIKNIKVTVGQWEEKDWIVLSGLKGNELIAVNQLQRLRSGMEVKPVTIDKSELK